MAEEDADDLKRPLDVFSEGRGSADWPFPAARVLEVKEV
jgi:hypothetical protein